MLTPEQSKAARTQLDLSQRRVAEQASLPRSYLNQFERGRWIPTDAFLSRLTEFYRARGGLVPEDPGPPAAEQTPEREEVSIDIAGNDDLTVDPAESEPKATSPNEDKRPGWRSVGRKVLVVGLIGSVLAATGNLPALLGVLKRLNRSQQPRSPYGF